MSGPAAGPTKMRDDEAVNVCGLCQREPGVAPLRDGASEHICGKCVARLAARLPSLTRLFSSGPKIPLAAEVLDPGSRVEFDPREIHEELAEIASPDEVDTHLDLAIAYREMGLLADAFAEYALVLEHARGAQLARALNSLLGKGSPFKGDVAALRDALYPA